MHVFIAVGNIIILVNSSVQVLYWIKWNILLDVLYFIILPADRLLQQITFNIHTYPVCLFFLPKLLTVYWYGGYRDTKILQNNSSTTKGCVMTLNKGHISKVKDSAHILKI